MSSTGTAAIHRMPGAGLLSRRRAWRTADSAEHLGWSHSTTWNTCNGMLRQTRAMTPSSLGKLHDRCQPSLPDHHRFRPHSRGRVRSVFLAGEERPTCFFPYLTPLNYLIARSEGMAIRSREAAPAKRDTQLYSR